MAQGAIEPDKLDAGFGAAANPDGQITLPPARVLFVEKAERLVVLGLVERLWNQVGEGVPQLGRQAACRLATDRAVFEVFDSVFVVRCVRAHRGNEQIRTDDCGDAAQEHSCENQCEQASSPPLGP